MGGSRIRGVNEEQVMHAMGLDDAYRVERELAHNAGGVTELVTIDGFGPFVRKRLPLTMANRGVWARLIDANSARLPRVAATYEMPDQFVAVYDYIPGPVLEQTVRLNGPFEPDDAVTLVLEVCEALSALHACGIVHLDITPGNIVLAADGAHVIDLGLARLRSDPEPQGMRAMGTWGFAAPEQYGFGAVDERTDVYATGRLLAYLLLGEAEEFSSPALDVRLHREIPQALAEVIAQACQMEPSRRYQSEEELARALRRAWGGSGDVVPPANGVAPGAAVATSSAAEAAGAGETAAAAGSDEAYDAARPAKDAEEGRGTRAVPRVSPPPDAAGHAHAHGWEPAKTDGNKRRRIMLATAALAIVLLGVLLAARGVWGGDGGAPASTSEAPTPDDLGLTADEPSAMAALAAKGEGSAPSEPAPDAKPLEIVESGYSVSQGFVHYGICIRNPNEGVLLEYPAIRITGYADDGTVVFSDEQYLGEIGAGETRYFGGQAGNGAAPARVDFEAIEPRSFEAVRSDATTSVFEVSNLASATDQIGMMTFSGLVRMVQEGSYETSSTGAAVTIILRDSTGKIVYGENAFVSSANEGTSVPFSGVMAGAPSYETAEAYAQSWL